MIEVKALKSFGGHGYFNSKYAITKGKIYKAEEYDCKVFGPCYTITTDVGTLGTFSTKLFKEISQNNNIMKVYKLKINYYNTQGNFVKGQYWTSNNSGNYFCGKQYLNGDFVENNPDIFKECTEEWLLEEAARRYPVGVEYTAIDIHGHPVDKVYKVEKYFEPYFHSKNSIALYHAKGLIYANGKWAEIVKKEPLFTTEDGVEVFEGDKYCHTTLGFKIECCNSATKSSGNLIGARGIKYFSTKEKAQEFIDLNKPQYSKQDVIDAYWNSFASEPNSGIANHQRKQRLERVLNELGKNV